MVKRQSNFIYAISLMALLSACAGRPTQPQHSKNNQQVPKTQVITPDQPKPSEPTAETKSAELPPTPTDTGMTGQQPPMPNPPAQPIPTNPALPKFGVILSGGGAKAWAHIGVLKEFQKLKWPISSIAGVEWGAAVAATYANNLSANEAEWEMSKLKEFDKWESFIKAAYANRTVGELKIPFVCPSLNIAKQSYFLLNRGMLSNLIPFCIPSPSLIPPINQSVALMTDVPLLAQHLRASGASRIILVNVLSQSNKRSFTSDYKSSDNVLWVQSASLMAKKPAGVDEVIEINLDDYGIADLNKRREIIVKGSELSYNQLKKLADKYGL